MCLCICMYFTQVEKSTVLPHFHTWLKSSCLLSVFFVLKLISFISYLWHNGKLACQLIKTNKIEFFSKYLQSFQ